MFHRVDYRLQAYPRLKGHGLGGKRVGFLICFVRVVLDTNNTVCRHTDLTTCPPFVLFPYTLIKHFFKEELRFAACRGPQQPNNSTNSTTTTHLDTKCHSCTTSISTNLHTQRPSMYNNLTIFANTSIFQLGPDQLVP